MSYVSTPPTAPAIFTKDTLLQAAVWLLLLCMAGFIVAHGFPRGDVTDVEAVNLLDAARYKAARAAADHQRVVASDYSIILGRIYGLIGREPSPRGGRLASVVGLLLVLGITYYGLRRDVGIPAACVGVIAIACSPATILLSMSAIPDALIAWCVLLASRCFFSESAPPANLTANNAVPVRHLSWQGSSRYFAGLICVGMAVFMAGGIDLKGWATGAEDRALAPLYTLLLGLPWVIGLLPLASRDFWTNLPPIQSALMQNALRLMGVALLMSVLTPALWIGCGLILLAGCAAVVGVAWQRAMDNQLVNGGLRFHQIATGILIIGVPTTAVAFGVDRIGTDYHFMERVQALVVVSIASITLLPLLLKLKQRQFALLPVVAVFVSLKILYANAYVAERDHWHSPKPYAQAIRRLLPADAVLHADLPISPAFRYYLGHDVLPIDILDRPPVDGLAHYAVFNDFEMRMATNSFPDRWQILRIIEGQAGQRLFVVRDQNRPIVEQTGWKSVRYPYH